MTISHESMKLEVSSTIAYEHLHAGLVLTINDEKYGYCPILEVYSKLLPDNFFLCLWKADMDKLLSESTYVLTEETFQSLIDERL
jgi:hypothetical protein